MFSLAGQTAIVTGGSQGIGLAIADRLASAGATVAIVDINEETGKKAVDRIANGCFYVHADITDATAIEKTVAEVLRRKGQIDILVNNAGIAGRAAPIEEQTNDDWQKIIAINLSGVFYFCRAVVPHMRARRYGRIVNIASIAGKEGNPRMIPYSATKAAVIGLTKSLGKELATETSLIQLQRLWLQNMESFADFLLYPQ